MKFPTVRSYCEGSGNNTLVEIGDLSLYFSYDTIIGFSSPKGSETRQNDWSTTTGKHLNAITPDKTLRIDGVKFEKKLIEVLKFHKLMENV